MSELQAFTGNHNKYFRASIYEWNVLMSASEFISKYLLSLHNGIRNYLRNLKSKMRKIIHDYRSL
jgi:hypothetical protein